VLTGVTLAQVLQDQYAKQILAATVSNILNIAVKYVSLDITFSAINTRRSRRSLSQSKSSSSSSSSFTLSEAGVSAVIKITYSAVSEAALTSKYNELTSTLSNSFKTGTFTNVMNSLASTVNSVLVNADCSSVSLNPPVVGSASTSSASVPVESFSGAPYYATIVCLTLVLPVLLVAAICFFCRRSKNQKQGDEEEYELEKRRAAAADSGDEAAEGMVGTHDHLDDFSGAGTSSASFQRASTTERGDFALSPKFELYSAYEDSTREVIEMTQEVNL